MDRRDRDRERDRGRDHDRDRGDRERDRRGGRKSDRKRRRRSSNNGPRNDRDYRSRHEYDNNKTGKADEAEEYYRRRSRSLTRNHRSSHRRDSAGNYYRAGDRRRSKRRNQSRSRGRRRQGRSPSRSRSYDDHRHYRYRSRRDYRSHSRDYDRHRRRRSRSESPPSRRRRHGRSRSRSREQHRRNDERYQYHRNHHHHHNQQQQQQQQNQRINAVVSDYSSGGEHAAEVPTAAASSAAAAAAAAPGPGAADESSLRRQGLSNRGYDDASDGEEDCRKYSSRNHSSQSRRRSRSRRSSRKKKSKRERRRRDSDRRSRSRSSRRGDYSSRSRSRSRSRSGGRRRSSRDDKKRSGRKSTKKKRQPKQPQKRRPKSSSSADESDRDDTVGHFEGGPNTMVGDRYRIVQDVGMGTFGRVVECIDTQQTHTDPTTGTTTDRVAIKLVRNIKRYYDSALIEADIVQAVNRRGGRGQSLISIMYDRFALPTEHYCLVFECLGPSLYDFIKKHDYRPFPMYCVRDFARQLLEALEFLHSMKLIHTDLKPENILLTTCGEIPYYHDNDDSNNGTTIPQMVPASTRIKVIDFGGATYDTESKSSVVNTRQYRAPEVILGLGWSMPSDLWSAGCIIAELYIGELLFGTHDNAEHLALIERAVGSFPREMVARATTNGEAFDSTGRHRGRDVLSSSSYTHVKRMEPIEAIVWDQDRHTGLIELLRALLVIDPARRATAGEALNGVDGMLFK